MMTDDKTRPQKGPGQVRRLPDAQRVYLQRP